MNIERLLDSRRQVKVFDDINIPDKSLIRNLLNTTHRLVPSKQNLLPYKVHVLGPECKKEKQGLYDLTKIISLSYDPKDTHNTQSLAPYVLIFTHRLAKPNPAVQRRIDRGQKVRVCDPKEYKKGNFSQLSLIEAGMFASILTALCLEKEIDVSYMKCFPHWPGGQHYWKELPFVDETPFLTMGLGYRKHKQQPRHQGIVGEDRPEVNEVINWI
tara:strand:- start:3293 stop:3934 length:642 start_codon:yes stop_codon:yes gene_type:complete